MEFSNNEIWGGLAVIFSLIAMIPYTISIFKGKTTPHIFSYIIWSIMMLIIFTAQIKNGAGAGAWNAGIITFYCIFVLLISPKYGEKNITRSDWVFLFIALLLIPLWYVTKNDLLIVTLAVSIDVIGYIPTFRKTYIKPYSEDLTAYSLSILELYFLLLHWNKLAI